MEKPAAKHKTVGLALGGGGAKGLAHIGVIRALECAGIGIDFIAGTSMGALVGGFYAATKDINCLERIMLDIKKSDISSLRNIVDKKDGTFFREESIAARLEKELKGIKIENCRIPFTAVTTNVKNGNEALLDNGDLIAAIRASAAIPLVFRPVEVENKLLMDGGLINPVPADVVRKMGAEFVIAVDVSSRWLETPEEMAGVRDMYSVLSRALSVLEYQLAKGVLKNSADVVIKPPIVRHDWFEFNNSAFFIKTGERETEFYISEIRKKTGYKKPPQTFAEKFLNFILDKPH